MLRIERPPARSLAAPALAAAAGVLAFTALAVSVSVHGGATRIDRPVADRVLMLREVFWTHLAKVLTFLGSELVVGVLAMLLVITLLERRGPRIAVIATIAVGTSAALTVGVKLLFGRARPGAADRLGPFDTSYSFPSGHTLSSAVLLGLVCLLLVPLVASRTARVLLTGTCVVLALGIGASRLYLGYHWTTDVLASWAIAAVILSGAHLARLVIAPTIQSGASQVRAASMTS